ncbi:MAG: hypothetical protein H0W81_06570 [Chloroflexi bacterium]|nr:hypothetical protein [Chloroflexota bacterium]
MTLLYVNATLTAITPVATVADFDVAASGGTPRFSGAAPATLRELIVERDGLDQDELVQTHLEVDYAVGRLVERGDTLTYDFDGTSHSRVAKDLIRARLVDRVRVLLHNA